MSLEAINGGKGMKPEPLIKEKRKTFIGASPLPKFDFFFVDDVKSAVQWLLKEIDKQRIGTENIAEEDKYDTAYKNAYLNALDIVEDLIKKAFEGVI